MASKILMNIARLSNSNATKVLQRQKTARSMSTLQPGVKAKMEKFGLEDATPVFKKNGTPDNLMFQVTVGACLTSLTLIGITFSRFAFKK
ncbi:uncharacterized protein COX7A [Halyomorpha halys]|uniref:uncharacterized protein COX7A n=1 Tax=Halyomorpha halys TaxID=286706 RepID=UPI0034D1B7C1